MHALPRYLSLGFLMLLFAMPLHAHAQEFASLEEAKAMALKAAQYVRDNGEEAALAEFNKAESEFIDRDLYVFAVNQEGEFTAHPIKPSLVGQNMMNLKDVNGTELVREFTEVESEGWVDYVWPHPVKKSIQPKSSYVVRVGDVILGVGAYK